MSKSTSLLFAGFYLCATASFGWKTISREFHKNYQRPRHYAFRSPSPCASGANEFDLLSDCLHPPVAGFLIQQINV
jgi:hypothetical protein